MRRVLAALTLACLPALVPTVASAHPLGNFTTNRYVGVTVSASTIDVDLVVDVAEIPSIELLAGIDTDADGTLDPAEEDIARRMLCTERATEVELTVDGRPVELELWAAGLAERPGAGGLATLRLACELRAPNMADGVLTLAVADAGGPGDLGWREIVVRGDGYRTDPSDAATDVAHRLTEYPADLLAQPVAERSTAVSLIPGGVALEGTAVPDARPLGPGDVPAQESNDGAVPGGVAGELPFVPDFSALTIGSGVIGLLVAALAGAGHALSPGHGKTVMAAYLVGARGGVRHALVLGAAVTVSHTVGVIGLAAVVLFASEVLPAERIFPILAATSGAAVIVIGAWLLVGCVRRFLAERRHAQAHMHGLHHDHDHGHEHAPPVPGLRGLIAIGVAGGLVPSTAALVLLLAATAAGQPAYGLAMALAFGTGMAAVLVGIGVAIVQGRDRIGHRLSERFRRMPALERATGAAPWAVAVVILVGGVILTGGALTQTL